MTEDAVYQAVEANASHNTCLANRIVMELNKQQYIAVCS